MSGDNQTLSELLDRVREGSDEAVRQLLQRYGPHIRTVIRQKLDIDMRSIFDSLDFLQDVWASFLTGELDHTFHDPNALMKFLVNMARNKVTDEVRRRVRGARHSLARERSLDGSARLEAAGLRAAVPTPGELAVAHEEWERLLEGRPAHHRRILLMLRQGHTHEEIAREMGLNERTVRRLIHKIASRPRK
jgi:RNA polymerase sigma-70 factor (ECF subfamily)